MAHGGSFHEALVPIVFIMQISGFLPFFIKKDTNFIQVVYKKASFRWCYALFTLFSISLESTCAILSIQNISIENFDTIFYRISSTYATICFFEFSKFWPYFAQYWNFQEFIFLKKDYQMPGKTLKFKIISVSCIILIPAYIEHGKYYKKLIMSCASKQQVINNEGCIILFSILCYYIMFIAVFFLISVHYELQHKVDLCNMTINYTIEFYYRNTRKHIFNFFPVFYNLSIIWLAVSYSKIYFLLIVDFHIKTSFLNLSLKINS